MSATHGRFVLEEDAECVRLRVKSADRTVLCRAALLAGMVLIAIVPTLALGGPLMAAISAILFMALVASSIVMASRAGVARSSYPRVRRRPK